MSERPQYFALVNDKEQNRTSVSIRNRRMSKQEAQTLRRILRGMSIINEVKRFDCRHGELVIHFHGAWKPENSQIVAKVIASREADIIQRTRDDGHRADCRRIRLGRQEKVAARTAPRSEIGNHFAIALLEGDLATGAVL